MSAVQSSITAASATWLEQMTQVGKEHIEAMQIAQLRHTEELLEQTRESDKRFQVVKHFLVENCNGMVGIVETLIEQVGGCQAEIQRFTRNAQNAQRRLEQMIESLRQETTQQNGEYAAENEIMGEMDEARRIWDEEVEELDVLEQRRRQQGEDQNESTELVSLGRLGENRGDQRKEEEIVPVSLEEKEEERGNGDDQVVAGKQVEKEELKTKVPVIEVAHRQKTR